MNPLPVRVKFPDGFSEGLLIEVRGDEGLVRYQSILETTEEVWLDLSRLLVRKMGWAAFAMDDLAETQRSRARSARCHETETTAISNREQVK